MRNILFLIFFPFIFVHAQAYQVPEQIQFAGMTLKLSSGARKEIENDIVAITKNQKYLVQKIDLANLYFPIIEKVFEEENFHEDFKFLALQESSLISDAVSSSNAVGYWQFKKETAQEVGLRVDRDVDERMNIVSSTRGAARYLKKNNNYLNNWVYTLLAYNLGRGGVRPHVKEKYQGATVMEIEKGMHWYVLRFLAHKLVYEDLVGKASHPELILETKMNVGNRSLEEVSDEFQIPFEDIKAYNKWLLQSRIPDDKSYAVILPIRLENSEAIAGLLNKSENVAVASTSTDVKTLKVKESDEAGSTNVSRTDLPAIIKYNKLKAVKSRKGDSFSVLAYATHLDLETFLERNDLSGNSKVVDNEYYYAEPKRTSASVPFHVLQEDESLWSVSQKYGVRVNNIKKKNRIKPNEVVKPGRVLWLKKKRPRKTEIEYKTVNSKTDQKQEKPAIPSVKVKEIGNTKEKKMAVTEALKDKTKIDQKLEKPITPIVKINETEKVKAKEIEAIKATNDNSNQTSDLNNSDQINADAEASEIQSASSVKTLSDIPSDKRVVKPKINEPVSSTTYHIVKQGESLYKIAKLYNTNIESLKKWNNLTIDRLDVGDKLEINKKPVLDEEITATVSLDKQPVINTVDEKDVESEINESNESFFHIVKQGESLYKIANHYNTKIDSLRKWNNLSQDRLDIGDKITIKQKKEIIEEVTAGEKIVYVARQGDTLYKLALEYKVSVKELMKWNNKKDSSVSIGEQIIIYK